MTQIDKEVNVRAQELDVRCAEAEARQVEAERRRLDAEVERDRLMHARRSQSSSVLKTGRWFPRLWET